MLEAKTHQVYIVSTEPTRANIKWRATVWIPTIDELCSERRLHLGKTLTEHRTFLASSLYIYEVPTSSPLTRYELCERRNPNP